MRFSKHNFVNFTVTVADPAVFTSADHELYAGDTVWLETTGALPTGLSVDTTYYVILNGITTNTFQLSTYEDGDPIATTGTQSGTHSWVKKTRARLTSYPEDNR